MSDGPRISLLNNLWIAVIALSCATPVSAIASETSDMQKLVGEARSLSRLSNRLNGVSTDQPLSSPKPNSPQRQVFLYSNIIRQAATSYRIPPDLIAAVIKCESNWKSAALSRKGARGLMQILPSTAKGEFQVDPDNLWDPSINIHVGTAYLRRLANRYAGDSHNTVAAYNAGPGRLESGKPIPKETRRYTNCIRRWFEIYWKHRE
jgi:soluble lytic murein transglycosylase-like protein